MAHRIWFPFMLVCLLVKQGSCEDEFKAGFSAGAESCKDYTNDNFNADNMNVAPMDSEDEDGAGAMCIEGSIELTVDIKEGAMITIEIEKETDAGSEPMFSMTSSLCESIKDEDAPTKALFAAMGIGGCPIESGTYSVNNMTIDLSFCKDMLSRYYVGDYLATVLISDDMKNVISCHNFGMCITEK